MTPPTMAGWNLTLRFGLEVTALAGLAFAGWHQLSGLARWGAVIAVPLAAAAIWGTFNVPGDPSRSGDAPIVVPGSVRLALELAVLGGGAAALAFSGRREFGLAAAMLIVLHYAASIPRVEWLIRT